MNCLNTYYERSKYDREKNWAFAAFKTFNNCFIRRTTEIVEAGLWTSFTEI